VRFKNFMEAEWVGKRRLPAIEALWEILNPLTKSNQHVIYVPSRRVGVRGSFSQDRGEYIRCVGVNVFKKRGLNAFGEFGDEGKHVVSVLQISPRDVWYLDPNVNEQNPWLTMNTHWADMVGEAQRLLLSHPRPKLMAAEWAGVTKKIEELYRLGLIGLPNPDQQNVVISNLKKLHHLIYRVAPSLLGQMKRPMARSTELHFPKPMDFKILVESHPITESQWVAILDRGAAKLVNTIEIPLFFGFEQVGGGFRVPDAKREAENKVAEELDALMNPLAEYLGEFLEIMEEKRRRLDYAIVRAGEIIREMKPLVKKMNAITGNKGVPNAIKNVINDFLTQAKTALKNIEDEESDVRDVSDKQYFTKKVEEMEEVLNGI
jgi:hypothetical protein